MKTTQNNALGGTKVSFARQTNSQSHIQSERTASAPAASAPAPAVKERGSGTKITIGFSNSQSGSNSTIASNGSSNHTPQIPDNLSTILTISDLCDLPDGRRLQNKRKRQDDKTNEKRGPKSHPPRGTHRPDTESLSGPQVEIINGKIVIKESSLMVPSMSLEHEDFEEVEEGIHSTAKYSSFTPSVHSSAWGLDETRRFYEALRQCGTDFSLMQAFFPRRTRKQLKNKFIREESHHPELIKATLNSQVPLDLAPFEIHLGTILPSGHSGHRGGVLDELSAIEPPSLHQSLTCETGHFPPPPYPHSRPSDVYPSSSSSSLPPLMDESELVDV